MAFWQGFFSDYHCSFIGGGVAGAGFCFGLSAYVEIWSQSRLVV